MAPDPPASGQPLRDQVAHDPAAKWIRLRAPLKLPESTGLDHSVSVADALAALRKDPERTLPPRPKLIDYFSPQASLDKVKNELRDLCTLLFTYFKPSLTGDFDWVATYRQYGAKSR